MGVAVVVTRRWTPQHATAFLPATGFSGFPSSSPFRPEKSQNTGIKKKAHSLAPAPAPTSDGTAIDQGIAYALMLVALALTYLIHTLDAPFNL
ncbi:Arabinogalactan protein 16 [Camellia lanceoleosa]|uniref:Arabinogalactan protein 16 n=1 Tax=Camellia lanceoleosa TaxID=1840588 RepID=A0ACC0G0I7_9ERIC|nr:Arabinogalactan protein 16 [Camellia lanceoleosa]